MPKTKKDRNLIPMTTKNDAFSGFKLLRQSLKRLPDETIFYTMAGWKKRYGTMMDGDADLWTSEHEITKTDLLDRMNNTERWERIKCIWRCQAYKIGNKHYKFCDYTA